MPDGGRGLQGFGGAAHAHENSRLLVWRQLAPASNLRDSPMAAEACLPHRVETAHTDARRWDRSAGAGRAKAARVESVGLGKIGDPRSDPLEKTPARRFACGDGAFVSATAHRAHARLVACQRVEGCAHAVIRAARRPCEGDPRVSGQRQRRPKHNARRKRRLPWTGARLQKGMYRTCVAPTRVAPAPPTAAFGGLGPIFRTRERIRRYESSRWPSTTSDRKRAVRDRFLDSDQAAGRCCNAYRGAPARRALQRVGSRRRRRGRIPDALA